MKKTTAIVVVTILSAAVLALGAFTIYEHMSMSGFGRVNEIYGEAALGELAASLTAMDDALRESKYSVSAPLSSRLYVDASMNAVSAMEAITRLPSTTQELEKMLGFLGGIRDYTFGLFWRATEGELPSDEERHVITLISKEMTTLAYEARGIAQAYADGALKMDGYGASGMENTDRDTVGWELHQLEQNMAVFEELLAQSANVTVMSEQTSESTEAPETAPDGASAISEDEARRIAAAFMGVPEQAVIFDGTSGGELPCQFFSVSASDGEEERIAVTLDGGEVAQWYSTRRPESGEVTEDEAVKKAERFLKAQGFGDFVEIKRRMDGGMCSVAYAKVEGEVIFLSDIVSAAVALDDGEICAFNAVKFYLNDREGLDITPGISADEAATMLPESLSPQATRLVMLEIKKGIELLCYEVGCRSDEGNVTVYVNARTGLQEKIMIQ